MERPIRVDKPSGTPCSVEGCDRTDRHTSEYCEMHYQRWRAWGDPLRGRPAPKGHLTGEGYRMIYVDGVKTLEHRHIIAAELGRPLLRSETVHHKNGDRSDNRRENLELWSYSQPAGQRVEDKLAWAREIVDLYGTTFN